MPTDQDKDKILDLFRAMLNVINEDGSTQCRLGMNYRINCYNCPFTIGENCMMRALLFGNKDLKDKGFTVDRCIDEIKKMALEKIKVEDSIFSDIIFSYTSKEICYDDLMKKSTLIYQGLPDKYKRETPVKLLPQPTDRFADLDVNDHDE